jgi:hypothetical protein
MGMKRAQNKRQSIKITPPMLMLTAAEAETGWRFGSPIQLELGSRRDDLVCSSFMIIFRSFCLTDVLQLRFPVGNSAFSWRYLNLWRSLISSVKWLGPLDWGCHSPQHPPDEYRWWLGTFRALFGLTGALPKVGNLNTCRVQMKILPR